LHDFGDSFGPVAVGTDTPNRQYPFPGKDQMDPPADEYRRL
jgi:hypothetical protein